MCGRNRFLPAETQPCILGHLMCTKFFFGQALPRTDPAGGGHNTPQDSLAGLGVYSLMSTLHPGLVPSFILWKWATLSRVWLKSVCAARYLIFCWTCTGRPETFSPHACFQIVEKDPRVLPVWPNQATSTWWNGVSATSFWFTIWT